MKLSSYFNDNQLLYDCDFEALGLSNSKPKMNFISFCDTTKYLNEINNNKDIVGIICKKEFVNYFKDRKLGMVVSNNPRREFFQLHNRLSHNYAYNFKMEKNIIGYGCKISKKATLSSNGIIIGDNVIIEDFVNIKGPCSIGDNCIIHSGVSIGGDGFEFKRYKDEVLDVVHCGSVNIGRNVNIWENTTIHRAVYPWDSTVIGDWSRIGAHTHIDHGTKIGDFVEICARGTISGRVIIGNYVFLGPSSTVSNRIVIGENAKILIGSVVTKNVGANQILSGNFAISHEKHMHMVREGANIELK